MKWINIKDELPEKAGFYLTVVNELSPFEDNFMSPIYEDLIKIIYFFKERNVTGWQKDWTKKPSNVKYWMPLPSSPKN